MKLFYQLNLETQTIDKKRININRFEAHPNVFLLDSKENRVDVSVLQHINYRPITSYLGFEFFLSLTIQNEAIQKLVPIINTQNTRYGNAPRFRQNRDSFLDKWKSDYDVIDLSDGYYLLIELFENCADIDFISLDDFNSPHIPKRNLRLNRIQETILDEDFMCYEQY